MKLKYGTLTDLARLLRDRIRPTIGDEHEFCVVIWKQLPDGTSEAGLATTSDSSRELANVLENSARMVQHEPAKPTLILPN